MEMAETDWFVQNIKEWMWFEPLGKHEGYAAENLIRGFHDKWIKAGFIDEYYFQI